MVITGSASENKTATESNLGTLMNDHDFTAPKPGVPGERDCLDDKEMVPLRLKKERENRK